MKKPVPRAKAYDLYWKFAFERQRVFERRLTGVAQPWTTDRVISHYKFCNVFRASDRVSQYMIRDVAYNVAKSTIEDRLFQIVAFRLFSKIETWDGVTAVLGHPPSVADLKSEAFVDALNKTQLRNGGLYTGAFILCANDAYKKKKKHLNHVELLRHMFVRESIASKIEKTPSLQMLYELLHGFPLIGDFMAYQIAVDINYSEFVSFSENDFTQPGPGALRGLAKMFTTLGDFSPRDTILWMVDHQEEEFQKLGLEFNGLFGRRLHAIDCQGLFCEVDKYCREKLPELKSARSRIKARFVASDNSLSYFFPPKWGIQVPRTTTTRSGQKQLGFALESVAR